MTINDLWHEVEVDPETAALDTAKREARKALSPKVSFLMEASTREAFEDRLALIDDDIDRIVSEAAGTGAAYAVARASVISDLNEMFDRGDSRRRRDDEARRARALRDNGPVVDERVLLARREARDAKFAVTGSHHKAATQAEVDAWLGKQNPLFAEWARPYAQRMVYGPTYNRSIANNLPEAARAFNVEGGMAGKQFRYVRSQLDAALGSERGEDWFWDEAQGEYTPRLQGTLGSRKQASYYITRREYIDEGSIVAGPFDTEDEAKAKFDEEGYPDEYMIATSEQLGKESAKQAKFVVRQRGTMSGGQHSYDTREEAQTKADALNEEHGTNDYIVSEEGDAKESARKTAVQVHTFESSGQAYNRVQTDESIKNGDVLVIPSEKVVGIAFSAWPAAVTKARGHLHGFTDPTGPPAGESYDTPEQIAAWAAGWAKAREVAQAKGWPLATSGDDYEDEPPSDEDGWMFGASKRANVMYSPNAPANFIADYDKVTKALEDGGWVMTLEDGATVVSPDAPPDLVRLYRSLYQLGYGAGHFATRKRAVEIFDKPAGGPRADVLWDLAADSGYSKTWVTTGEGYEGRVSTTPEGAIGNYNGRFAGEYSNAGRAMKAIEEMIAKDHPNAFMRESKKMDLLWREVDGVTTTEVGKVAMTVVPDRIGVAWAITNKDGSVEHAAGKSRTIESAKEAMIKRADIFGQDPDVVSTAPKKKVKKKKVVSDTEEVVEDPDAEDEVEDEEDEDLIEDDAEDEFPVEEEAVETVDPMTLDVGDTVTVSYTMGTGETGEVEGVFVRNENDIVFFSGPNGEFGVAERDGTWIDSEGNQFSFSFGSPDVTGETDPNADFVEPDNPATPAEDPPVADKKDEGNTEYKVDDDKPKKKKKDNQPPWLKGKSTLTTSTVNTGTPMTTASVVYVTQPTTPIRSMAELVTAIGDLSPNLSPEEVFDLAKQAMTASKERAGR